MKSFIGWINPMDEFSAWYKSDITLWSFLRSGIDSSANWGWGSHPLQFGLCQSDTCQLLGNGLFTLVLVFENMFVSL